MLLAKISSYSKRKGRKDPQKYWLLRSIPQKRSKRTEVHPEECEELYSREEVISVLEEELGKPINAKTYINDSAPMVKRRERINKMINEKV